jgi:hypothetical protein
MTIHYDDNYTSQKELMKGQALKCVKCAYASYRLQLNVICVKIYESIWDNWRIITDQVTSEINTGHGRKERKNGLMPKRKHFILIKDVALWTIGRNILKAGRLHTNKKCV